MIKKTPKIGKIVKYDGCKVYLSKLIYEKNMRKKPILGSKFSYLKCIFFFCISKIASKDPESISQNLEKLE